MKISALTTLCLLAPLGAHAQTELPDQKSKLSYSIGLEAAEMIKRQMIDVDLEQVQAGIADGLQGKSRMSESKVRETLIALQTSVAEKKAAARKAAGEQNAIEGPKFLAANKTKEGVHTTASGLQYKVLQEGSGRSPGDNDRVVVNFIGMTTDGKEFENTYKIGHAETLPVSRMVKGWREGLGLMKIGAKYRFFIPPDLAFGKLGAGIVTPNATLIFDMELLGIPDVQAPAPLAPRKVLSASPSASP